MSSKQASRNSNNEKSANFSFEETILSIYSSISRSAISFYEKSSHKIHCLRFEEPENPLLKFQEILAYIQKMQPQTIILQKTGTELLLEKIKENLDILQENQSDNEHNLFLFLKKAEYNELNFQNAIIQLDFNGVVEETYFSSNEISAQITTEDSFYHKKLCFLRSYFQLIHFPEIFFSLGALVVVLLQNGEINSKYSISNIKLQEKESLMFISKKSFEALQIFKEEVHPSLIKGKGKSKEGFSLYNVFENLMTTAQGKRLLKRRMKSPLYDKGKLQQRLDVITLLLNNLHEQELRNLKKILAKICDFGAILVKFREYRNQSEEWRKLKQGLEETFHLVSFFKSIENATILQKEIKSINELLNVSPIDLFDGLKNIINKCLNFSQESNINNKKTLEINHGINEELDNLKRVFSQLDDFLELYAQDELNKLRTFSQNNPCKKIISSIGFSFFPQVGYMILIPKTDSVSNESSHSNKQNSDLVHLLSSSKKISKHSTNVNEQIDFNKFNFESEKPQQQPRENLNDESDSSSDSNVISFDEQDLIIKHEAINHLREKLPHRKIFHEIFGLPDDWDFHFELEDFLYFKNAFTNDLDVTYGDIYERSLVIEQEILRVLEEEVLKINEDLLYLNDLIAEIDFLSGFALAALQYNLKCPKFCSESMLLIRNGRHLLMEILLKQSYISNDFFVYNFKDEYDNNFEAPQESLINKHYSNRISILTGPNFSGKSVFLKKIGLIVYMAQIGSYVPAEYCKLGLFDKILTNINLNDSLSCAENGIIEEIQGLLENLRLATNRSLILIDELGRNSNHEDNLALFIALIKYLATTNDFSINKILTENLNLANDHEIMIQKNMDFFEQMRKQYEIIPLVILATHLKDLELIQENYLVRYLEMQVIFLDKNNQEIEMDSSSFHNDPSKAYENRVKQWKQLDLTKKIVYLYRLKPGFSLNSFAIFLANDCLNEDWIVKRAFEIHCSILNFEKVSPLEEIQQHFLEKTKSLIERITSL